MATRYPMTIPFDTDLGGGEARKPAQGESWLVSHPEGDFRYYGSTTEMKAECRKRGMQVTKWDPPTGDRA